jgi:hypothetical protein
MKKPTTDPFVFTKKTPYMQRISDLVRLNHNRYICGQIPIKKVKYFSEKMNFLYRCFDGKVTAHRNRLKGYSSARLLLYYPADSTHVTWILLVTPGEWFTPDSGNEKWLDPAIDRINVTGYELVRHIRSGNSNPSWTWRYTVARYNELRDIIIQSIRRRHMHEVNQTIQSVWRSPAFAGIREQIKKIAKLIISEWERSGVGDPPELPAGLGYVRRIPDKGVALSKIIKGIENAEKEAA